MRRDYLGDALDFWKRAMLDVLRESSGGRCLKVLPMFTDDGWDSNAYEYYAAVLGVTRCDFLTTKRLHGRRKAYFPPLEVIKKWNPDVFLDPDIGIAEKGDKEHVTAKEITDYLSEDNVVAIYQHRPQNRRSHGWLLLSKYRRLFPGGGVRLLGYEARQVGMLFATRSKGRAERLRCAFVRRFGVAVKKRLHYLP